MASLQVLHNCNKTMPPPSPSCTPPRTELTTKVNNNFPLSLHEHIIILSLSLPLRLHEHLSLWFSVQSWFRYRAMYTFLRSHCICLIDKNVVNNVANCFALIMHNCRYDSLIYFACSLCQTLETIN